MNFTDPKFWLELVIVVWNMGLTAAIWLRKPGQDASAAVEALREEHGGELSSVNLRLAQIQTEMKHMPTSEELAQLEGTVGKINERTEGMADNMQTMRGQLNRIETYLLNQKS